MAEHPKARRIEARPAVELAIGARSEVGLVRRVNEDSVICEPPVVLVADGMGGYAAGDVASSTVVDEFSQATGAGSVTAEWVQQRFSRANERIKQGVGGGTTVAGAAIVREGGEPYWLVFNLGDSRVYRSTGRDVRQVTVDHSVVQEMVDAGEITAEAARVHPRRNVVTRALGSPDEIRPDFWMIPVIQGDRLLICSDGLTSEVDGGEIRRIMTRSTDPRRTADELITAALSRGGRDNVSAVVVDVVSTGVADSEGPGEGRTRPRESGTGTVDDAESTRPRPHAPAVLTEGGR